MGTERWALDDGEGKGGLFAVEIAEEDPLLKRTLSSPGGHSLVSPGASYVLDLKEGERMAGWEGGGRSLEATSEGERRRES